MALKTCRIENTDITWIDLADPSQEEVHSVSSEYNLNSYTLLDSLDPDHLPKYEEHNDTHFLIIRLLHDEKQKMPSIQSLSSKIAVFFTDTFIITLHRSSLPLIEEVRGNYVDSGKIKTAAGVAIQIVTDALRTFEGPAIDLSNAIDYYESKLFLSKNIAPDMIEGIYYLKNKAGLYKKLLLLSNEVVSSIHALGEERPALRDARDLHTKLVLLYDQVLDDAHNLLNIYLSLSAQKTNDVMKLLTIFSVFFMPLTFIVGVYGMNFKYMPELRSPLGYPLTLLIMLVICFVIFFWFKRKKWL
ncbi:CorA family divalent cation transporter [Flavobacterium sp. SORGH_AS_0622]|uniref:magnesium transporter CorA family protein n=1 Tax=Flavobacterium sp. SORGH_AS_0622 TaxID=3041772 RepID=UPI00278A6F52|nr:CorA family divalent cation transporter [Flavobacterium sp. SORGH_AS_0622]MDQ1165647.1 magnesium transporter [Flavobacterium sp. SORGH_AS_0622]